MKFACFVETEARPRRRPLAPASSIRRAAWSSLGFLKTLPQLGSASGCVAPPPLSGLVHERPDGDRLAGPRDRGAAPDHDAVRSPNEERR